MGKLVGIGLLLAFAAAVLVAAQGELRTRCEVCMEFEGREACEVARARDEDHAIREATTTACAKISGGVTNGIRCSNTPPRSTRCES